MQGLLPVIAFFTGHPLVTFVVALVFIVPCFYPVYSGRQKTLLFPCSMVWLVFGLWSFYMLGQNVNIVESIHPVLFFVLLTIACLGLVIVLKGLIRRPTESCLTE